MLRSAFIVFLAGWVLWFWMDKPSQGRFRMPQVSDSLVENFQSAFNMMKAGYLDMAFVYIWGAHYILLSLLGGAILAVAYGSVADYLGRKRMRRHFQPPAREARQPAADKNPPEPPAAPADKSES
jgi:hypothetical protein